MIRKLKPEALALLKTLISIPSFSKDEGGTADIIARFFTNKNIDFHRKGNNIWVKSANWRESLPTILLNSHHDTVRPTDGWTHDPFVPLVENGRLYGLGSNDAGGPLVALIACFLYFYDRADLPFNLLLAVTAEEEISGKTGIASILPELGNIYGGILGEPTRMHMAITEKGLLVVDAEAKGKAGHAAREEGINAIYKALEDIARLRQCQFDKVSPLLGKVKLSVTGIQAGTQHNVVPASCRFVIDIRTNEEYSTREVFEILQQTLSSELKARSFRLNSSKIEPSHPLVQSGQKLGLPCFGSPTLSDQALLPFPTIKIGPGHSARSHSADEFILLSEIEEGIDLYIQLIEGLNI